MTGPGRGDADLTRFVHRVLIVALVVAAALLAWYLAWVFLLAFAGVLLSVMLRNLAEQTGRFLPIGPTAALPLVILSLVVLLGLVGLFFGAEVAADFQRLAFRMRRALDDIAEDLEQYETIQYLIEQAQEIEAEAMVGQGVLGPITGVAMVVVETAATVLLIIAIAVFMAVSPDLYRDGVVRLVPVAYRARAREVFAELDRMLWGWLIGQLIAMAFVGVATTTGLLLLGAPLAVPLGLLATLFNFVPFVGPIAAAVPAVVIAFAEGGKLALWVALLYLVVQQVEGYVVMPLVQRWAVALPPVLAVVSIVIFGLLFGLPGILFATPLMVAAMGLVRMVYVEDMLEGGNGEARGTDPPDRQSSPDAA
jgi:predicted PurR-regulated permease PerM